MGCRSGVGKGLWLKAGDERWRALWRGGYQG